MSETIAEILMCIIFHCSDIFSICIRHCREFPTMSEYYGNFQGENTARDYPVATLSGRALI
jgi:hypothetical protein